jgi:hypothetical protein
VMDPVYRVVGITIGPHPVYGAMAAVDFAGDFLARDASGHLAPQFDLSKWRGTVLDVGRDVPDITSQERDFLLLVNIARADPAGFSSDILDVAANHILGSSVVTDDSRRIFVGKPDNISKAKTFFRNMKPLPPVEFEPSLSKAAAATTAELIRLNPPVDDVNSLIESNVGGRYVNASRIGSFTLGEVMLDYAPVKLSVLQTLVNEACGINTPDLLSPRKTRIGTAYGARAIPDQGGPWKTDFVIYYIGHAAVGR